MKCGNSSFRYVICLNMNLPLHTLRTRSAGYEKNLLSVCNISPLIPRQRALMQILYQKCEFSSEMISEAEIRKKIGFSYPVIRSVLQLCIRNGLLPEETNVEISLIVLHSAFVGIIKNWLVEPGKFDLYHQAPALVDNIMSVLCGTRGLQAIVNH
ncbi:transcription repressor of multidrug efflux pump acrAB operon [Klebsiella oxytoca]|nr:transcription repressor of multidrug efflux pump acrAB operon [Klebsiella oxytoca]